MRSSSLSPRSSRKKPPMENERLYLRDVKIILASRVWCEIGPAVEQAIPGHECGRRSTQVHHRRDRNSGGSLRLPLQLVATCGRCHPGPVHFDPEDRVRKLKLRVVTGPNAGRLIVLTEGDDEWEACGRRAARLGVEDTNQGAEQ